MKISGNKLISECTEYDFKQELERKKISHWLKSVSAYANSEGGALYYGVDNDGIVTGLANPQGDSDFISQKINAHLDPVPDWTLTPGEDEQGHKVLEVLIRRGSLRHITLSWTAPVKHISVPVTRVLREPPDSS